MSKASRTIRKMLPIIEWGTLVLLVGAMLGYVIFLSVKKTKSQDAEIVVETNVEGTEGSGHRDILQPNESAAPKQAKTEKVKVPEGNFQVTMTTTWNYENIDIPAEDSYVENAWNNTYDMTFTVMLAEDESKVLYSSPRMPVGSYMTKIPIKNVALETGSYDCVVAYNLFTPDTDEEIGNVRVGLKINIGNP